MAENRRHPRVASRLRCWCEGDNVTVYARVGNISQGGLFVRTSTPLETGARAVLRFGQDAGVEASAVVVWARVDGDAGPPGMGLRFEPGDAGRDQAIRRVVEVEEQASKNQRG